MTTVLGHACDHSMRMRPGSYLLVCIFNTNQFKWLGNLVFSNSLNIDDDYEDDFLIGLHDLKYLK